MAKNLMSITSAITRANFDEFWFGEEFEILLDETVMKCVVFQSDRTVGDLGLKEHWGLSFEWEDGTQVMYEGTKDRETTIMTSANLIPRCHLGADQQLKYKRNIGKLENKSKKDVHEAAYKNPCNFTTYSEEHNSYHDWIKQFGESLGVIVSPPIKGRRKTVSNYAKQGAIVVATTAGVAGIITGIRTLWAVDAPHYSLIAKTASGVMIMMSCFFLVKVNPAQNFGHLALSQPQDKLCKKKGAGDKTNKSASTGTSLLNFASSLKKVKQQFEEIDMTTDENLDVEHFGEIDEATDENLDAEHFGEIDEATDENLDAEHFEEIDETTEENLDAEFG